ncbi:2-hydroxyacid dehydrogenase [Mycolicibacterium komossense]|uniref:Hydroxyacid dehydrogenase n=1 Tax=Mycolicibacterium komossense TaxID=1779 RepID=A0ABT3CFI9_9MYCO|nr:2-hydroxyacid dehydrogenase [Mycolicibacterium komossense]MCV7228250.1 hydroxyacid dehydrogenase [Mycolicibacterium komossense]
MDSEKAALRVLAHFTPGSKVADQVAAEADWLDIRWVAEDDDEALHRELPEAAVIWHVLRPLTDADLERAPKLKLIHKLGAGVNTIDLEAATKRGVAVANMPGANAPSVAEATVMMMLAALRRLPQLDRLTREGRGWPADPELGDNVRDLGSCTVGLVGYGNVAKRVEQIVRTMGTHVIHTSSTRDEFHVHWTTLNEVLKNSDIVSLHLPLTPATERLIDAEAIAKMKPGAILVNTSRGGVVDEGALVEALRSGQLAAAALDVFTEEPVAPDNPLLSLDNVLLTPHVSWYTADTMTRYLVAAINNCRRLRDGLAPYSVVNRI